MEAGGKGDIHEILTREGFRPRLAMLWLNGRNEDLGGVTPHQAWDEGRREEVIACARAFARGRRVAHQPAPPGPPNPPKPAWHRPIA